MNIHSVLIIIAIVAEGLAMVNVSLGTINLVALGLFAYFLSMVV